MYTRIRANFPTFALLLFCGLALAGCSDDESPTEPPPPQPEPQPELLVTIFERDDFEGASVTLPGSVGDLRDLPGPCLGNWNDCVSSLRISEGAMVILWERDGFEGEFLPIRNDISDLDNIPGCDADWDNCASSIELRAE